MRITPPTHHIANIGTFVLIPLETPFYYRVEQNGLPLGNIAYRYGELNVLRTYPRGDEDNRYYTSDKQWTPVESINDGLRFLCSAREFSHYIIETRDGDNELVHGRTAPTLEQANDDALFQRQITVADNNGKFEPHTTKILTCDKVGNTECVEMWL